MPKFPDHPLVVARERAGLSQSELARRAGVSRLTVAKIEGAVTRTLDADTANQLIRHLVTHGSGHALQQQIDRWFAYLKPRDHISAAARSILHLSPAGLTERFTSFHDWRSAIAPSTEFFAALIGVHRQTVEAYEKGIRVGGMSSKLASALLELGISSEYLTALRQLPPKGR